MRTCIRESWSEPETAENQPTVAKLLADCSGVQVGQWPGCNPLLAKKTAWFDHWASQGARLDNGGHVSIDSVTCNSWTTKQRYSPNQEAGSESSDIRQNR